MEIKFNHCNGGGTEFLADLAKQEKVDKYLQSLIDCMEEKDNSSRPGFLPLECAFVEPYRGRMRWIIKDGAIAEDAKRNIMWLKRQPLFVRKVMSDDIQITGDWFERELYFKWT